MDRLPSAEPFQHPDAYDGVADAYDRFWGDALAPAMLGALDRLLASVPPTDGRGRLLDLCCGTGQLAAGLTDRGWTVVGVDGAEAMLERARRRAPTTTFVRSDMRAFGIGGVLPGESGSEPPFDVVVCAFDSLNHLPDAAALEEVLGRVFGALRPGGRFVFDVNLRAGFEARFEGSLGFADTDLVCVVNAGFDGLYGRYDIAVLRPEAPAALEAPAVPETAWRRTDTTLVQRCFELSEILAALANSGFPDPVVLDAEDDLGMDGHIGRAVFVVDRPG
ncbi:MAG: class I SAM-dependent methyltransferase [Ardenticatenales bacterium]|nr:class I SAM-dependent methyltransferase [Ardenticatenales bacterium]